MYGTSCIPFISTTPYFFKVNFNVSHPSTLSSPECSFIFSFLFPPNKFFYRLGIVGHDSSVSIATRYGLDGPGIESRRGRDIPNSSRPVLWPTQPHIQWVPGLSQEVKRSERCVDHPPSTRAEVKEREPYIYFLSETSWPVLG